jgi:hypothetical protein
MIAWITLLTQGVFNEEITELIPKEITVWNIS